MEILNNEESMKFVDGKRKFIEQVKKDRLIFEPFYKDFTYRFCWNSNAIEGNTLSLDETISLLEYDEVRSGHTYSEYEEAKRLNQAISEMLSERYTEITEEWLVKAVHLITGRYKEYRTDDVYIGTMIEAVYYPPSFSSVPKLMSQFIADIGFVQDSVKDVIEKTAKAHIEFERIHPFHDGNGRTGRLMLNQMLLNGGLLPITFSDQSKYRQAFRRYERNQDLSLLVYLICKGQKEAIKNVEKLCSKREKSRNRQM